MVTKCIHKLNLFMYTFLVEIKLEILALEKQRTCNVKNVRDLEKELSDAKEALTKLNEGEIAQDNDIPMYMSQLKK